ncbi:MAG TPA: Fe-Mn family superoxide dismutase [Burkholderiaceae bacterium]|nr:Fe-Mn family superoxide dismutase [Burkholderiaceae bacterium]
MHRPIAPIPCRPWTLNGLSERLIVSHYENTYGGAVRSANAIRSDLDALDPETAPGHLIRALKREELLAVTSVALHELYFGNLGGDGAATASMDAVLHEHFGSVDAWRREFVAAAQSLRGGSAWVMLFYSRRDRRLHNQVSFEHGPTMIDAAPLLVLDMYEHAYQLDFGANAPAYVDAFLRNIDWAVVDRRFVDAVGGATPAARGADDETPPSVSIEEFAARRAGRERLQLLDARPRHYYSRSTDMMQGALWRDPTRVSEWSHELSPDAPVFVYCAYGFHVGRGVATELRARGFDAKFIRGGLSAWYAAGGERALKATDPAAT